MRLLIFIPVMTALLLASCARAPIQRPEEALRLTSEMPELREATPITDFAENLERNIAHLRASRRVSQFRFGERVISREEYLRALEFLLSLVRENAEPAVLTQKIREHFDAYEVFGRANWGEVFITSYFEPVIEGREKRDNKFRQPLYLIPEDLVEVKLREMGAEYVSFPSAIRGRLVSAKESQDGIAEVVPYFSREEIDGADAVLKGKRLEIAWVDPVDSFFLQIQGSGVVHFPNGKELRVAYGAQNGHAYEPVGKFLRHAIPIEEMSLDRIESYLHAQTPAEMQRYLNMNPSYVFFKPAEENAITYLGTSAVGLRTIATDAKFFPKGAVVMLEFDRPVFQDDSSMVVKEWAKTAQLMVDQDVGGAIKGADRVDLFWGRGMEAKRAAGVIKQLGRLRYLAPKEDLLKTLREKQG